MSFPEDTLGRDEQLLLHRHPHWKMLFFPAVEFVVASALAGFLIGLAADRIDDANIALGVVVAIVIVWALFVLARCVSKLIRWKTTHFVITDRRVLTRTGLFNHVGSVIPVGRISNVQFRNTLWDRMFGTGTLIIESSSQEPLELDDIPQIRSVHARLDEVVYDAVQYDRNDDGWPDRRRR